MAKKEAKQNKNSFFKGMKAELKKVVWPTPKELFKNTVAVIVFVLIIAVIVFILDLCFDNLNKYGITKLQETVHSSLNENYESEDNTNSDETNDSSENETTETETNNSEESAEETTSETNNGETTAENSAE